MFFSVVRQEVKIGKVIIHEQFEPETFDNDIALVCKFFIPPPKKKNQKVWNISDKTGATGLTGGAHSSLLALHQVLQGDPDDDDDEDQDYDQHDQHHNDEDIDDSACLNPFPLRIFLEVLKSGLQVIADADFYQFLFELLICLADQPGWRLVFLRRCRFLSVSLLIVNKSGRSTWLEISFPLKVQTCCKTSMAKVDCSKFLPKAYKLQIIQGVFFNCFRLKRYKCQIT